MSTWKNPAVTFVGVAFAAAVLFAVISANVERRPLRGATETSARRAQRVTVLMSGAEMGKLVGLIDGIEGQKFPPPEVLDALAKLHGTEIYVDGPDLDEWSRGFKAAYRLTWRNARRAPSKT